MPADLICMRHNVHASSQTEEWPAREAQPAVGMAEVIQAMSITDAGNYRNTSRKQTTTQ